MHEYGAVPVNAPDLLLRFIQRDSQGNAAAVAHGTDRQKIVLMALTVCRPDLKQLTACLARGGDDGIPAGDGGDVPDDLLPGHRIAVAVDHLFRILQRAFTDDESDVPAGGKNRPECRHGSLRLRISGILSDHIGTDPHILQKLQRYFSLINMLRLIVEAGLPAPADDEDDGDRVDPVIQQAGCRIDDIAFPGVLHINNGDLSGRQMVSGGKRRAVSLVGGDDMMLRIDPVTVHQAIAQRPKLRIRDTRIKIRADQLQKLFHTHFPVLLYPKVYVHGREMSTTA